MIIFKPFTLAINQITKFIFKIFGIPIKVKKQGPDSRQLGIILKDASSDISSHYKQMLLNILKSENINVENIMVPIEQSEGIDIDELSSINEQLKKIHHKDLIIFSKNKNNIIGTVNTF